MLSFLSANWLWILLIGGMLWMHLGHGGHGGHGGGCGGGHQHSGTGHDTSTEENPPQDASGGEHTHHRHDQIR